MTVHAACVAMGWRKHTLTVVDSPAALNRAAVGRSGPLDVVQFAWQMARCLGGYAIDHTAEQLAKAAGLPASWRGNWDALGDWMRERLDIDDRVLAAVRAHAARMGDASISSIRLFDGTVRKTARPYGYYSNTVRL
jgi:hypothetical protein